MTRPQQEESLTLFNLKSYLLDLKKEAYAKTVRVECHKEACSSCKVLIDNKAREKEISLFTQMPTIYAFNNNGYFERQDRQDKSCFSYAVTKNNAGEKLFVEYKDEYYIFYPYIHDVKKFVHFEEAKMEYDPKEVIPTQKNQYYAF